VSRAPALTAVFILLCLALYVSDSQQWSIYNRQFATQGWRFFTASFSHYNFSHLISNVAVLLVLGSLFEFENHKFELMFLMFIVTLSTVTFLHFYLPEYDTFAGISCLNYALIGWIVCREGRRYFVGVSATMLLLVSYEIYVVAYESKQQYTGIMPVWQLHLLAFFQGVIFFVLQRVLLKSYWSRIGS
jgi:membrane associated rhomboid family serine protease